MNVKIRQSNFELLRIVCMILILMSHCDDFFGLSNLYSETIGINKIITDFLHMGGSIGVGCFVLISGYFLIEQNFSLKKLLKILGSVWFYTIIIWLIWILTIVFQGNFELGKIFKETLYAFFPVTLSHYWFVTAYVIILILSPFMNKLIFALDYQNYKKFLAIIIIIFVFIAGGIPLVLTGVFNGRIFPMMMLYFIAGFIKRFRNEKKFNASRHFIIALLLYLMLFSSAYIFTYIGTKLGITAIIDGMYFYRKLNSPLIVGICVEMFIAFFELNVKNSKLINEIASCTFGVYLIHGNRLLNPLFIKLFPIYKVTNSFYILVYSIIAVVTIYISCTLIEFLRKKTIEKIWVSYLNKHLDAITNRIKLFSFKIINSTKKIGQSFYKTKKI